MKKTSYSKKLWYELDISVEKFVSEVKHTTINFSELTEWPKIQEWATKIEEWRAEHIGHSVSDGCKIGIYGELFAAALTVGHCNNFDEWLFTMAIVGKGDNTNQDFRKDWLNIKHDIEVKTVNKFNDRVRIEVKRDKRFVYPEVLLVVKEIDLHQYYIHSITEKKILEKVVKIYPGIHGGTARIFNLCDLTPVMQF